MLVLFAVLLAVGVSALLLAGSFASAQPEATRPRVFFDPTRTPPPGREIVELQRRFPEPLGAIVPVQRGLSEAASDAAGYLLVMLGTAAVFVLGHDQVLATYRASLGSWRAQLRVLLTGLAVLGVAASATALSWIVFLGSVATGFRGGPFGVPAALQAGIAAFSVAMVVVGLAALVGFAASAWRLGDTVFRAPGLRRIATEVPTPLVALLGATVIYIVWQLPIVGAIAVVAALAYSLGAVVSARLAHTADANVLLSPHDPRRGRLQLRGTPGLGGGRAGPRLRMPLPRVPAQNRERIRLPGQVQRR